jgi:hypothetical protein
MGRTFADTDEALAKLTQAMGDPKKALDALNVTSEIAARQHTSLASAADITVKAYAKSPMALRQFGINLKDSTDAGKAAEKAVKDQTKAHEGLAKAQQNLTDTQARLGASTGAAGTRNQEAVARAQDAVARAGQHLQDVQAKLALGHTSAAVAAHELQMAQDGVTAAQAKLDAAQGKATGTTKLSVAQQIELRKAQDAVTEAKKKADDADKAAAASQGDLNKANVDGGQVLDMIHAKVKGLDVAQSETFGGHMRAIKATVVDFAATYGEQFGGKLVAAGPLIAGFGSILESGAIGKIGKLGKGIAGGAVSFVKFGASAIKAGAEAAAAGFEAILPWLPLIAAITAVGLIAYEVYKHWSTVKAALAAVWNGIKTAALAVWDAIKTGVMDAVHWVEGLPGKIQGAVMGAVHWLENVGKDILGGLVAGIKWYWTNVAEKELKIYEWILGKIGDAALWLVDKGKDVLRGLWNGIKWVWDNEIAGLLKIKNWLLTAIEVDGKVVSWLESAGSDIIHGLWNGLSSAKDWFVGQFEKYVKDVIPGPIRKVLGLSSPSKLMAGFGKNIVEGLAGGITGNAHLATRAMADLGSGLTVPTITLPPVGGRAPALTGAAAAPVAGPQTIHYHYKIDKPTIQAANLGDLTDAMKREAARANFSGEGSGVDW